MLTRIDGLSADIAELEATLEEMVAPFAETITRLDEIPGVGPVGAAVVVSEIGLDMSRFPTAGHLASWAKFTPQTKQSAGKTTGRGSTGHGNRYLAKVLGEAAVTAGRTNTFLGERYRRIARRRGKKKATVAVGRSILVITWHLLADPKARYTELGPDFHDRRRPRTQEASSHPATRSTRLHRHHHPGRLTSRPARPLTPLRGVPSACRSRLGIFGSECEGSAVQQ